MPRKATPFIELARVFDRLQEISSSLAMIDILAEFFKDITPEEARMAAYLLRGQIAPEYAMREFGLAEKLAFRAVAHAATREVEEVQKLYHKKGDLGLVAEELLARKRGKGLTVSAVFKELEKIAAASGSGSQEQKVAALSALLSRCSPLEARYVVRTVLGQQRLGVGDMTFLNALSKALTGSKDKKPVLEHAFNVFSDLGEVALQALAHGMEKLERAEPVIGVPIRVMLGERVEDLEDIKKHIPGRVFVEYKYDGERIQAHIRSKGDVTLFSRRHENITHQFPDVIAALGASFKGKNAIVEGEAVAIDLETGRLQPFQVLMSRRRKHDVDEYVRKIPVKCFLFDILFLDGRSVMPLPMRERKAQLTKRFADLPGAGPGEFIETEDVGELEGYFTETMKRGAEGIMVKDAESTYKAGHRGWNWIKYKKEYKTELADTFDVVVVGALYGRGQRAGTYGSLLAAAYDPETDKYYSLTKVGAGFTDEDLAKLPKMLDKYKRKEKHRLVETGMAMDVWFDPVVVMEIKGAELTVSPNHTAAKDKVKKGGLALRFPRLLRWRDDKRADQATTVKEIYDMYGRARGEK